MQIHKISINYIRLWYQEEVEHFLRSSVKSKQNSSLNTQFLNLKGQKMYGKARIYVIVNRNFGIDISESSTGGIMKKPRFSRFRRALSCRERRMDIKYDRPFKRKKLNEIRDCQLIQDKANL